MTDEKPRITILTWVTTVVAIYHFAMVAALPTWFNLFIPDTVHKAISILSALLLVYWLLPAGGKPHGEDTRGEAYTRKIPWYDYLLFGSALIGAGFVIVDHETILDYGEFGFLDTKGIVFGLMLAIPLLEAVRRTTGLALPIIILFFCAICIFQNYLPGLLYGRGYPLDRLVYSVYAGEAGIFGLPAGIAANIVIIFLVFGALMQGAGASKWFMDMAMALTGWSRGGPAKAAVVASAMFGSISGSPSGNSATTGVFTIPLMRNVGYTAPFAAAVEAVASTGGIILPPVMGAIAFIMAEWIETTYANIVIAAAAPALLYFLIVFVSVHLRAQRDGIERLPAEDMPSFWPVFFRGWYYLLPIVALVYFLVFQALDPGFAAAYACGAVLVASFLSKDRSNWLTPLRIMKAFEDGVTRWIVVASITAAVGIMISALELSGVGVKVSRFIVELSAGDLLLTLLLVGIVSLIVGMGLDATPAYITLATLMAPALIRLGVSDMAAHLFVIYWGLASFFTPPTCIAVFVTSGLAGSRVWPTGWEAVKLGIAAFLIPFAFVLNDGLLMKGSVTNIALALSTAIAGACILAAAICGYAFGKLNPIQRLLMAGGGLLLIGPGLYPPLAGAGLGALALVPQYFRTAHKAKVT